MIRALMVSSLTLLVFATSPAPAQAKKGFYFGFNLGGAVASGDTAIPMRNPGLDPDYASGLADLNILFSTDEGDGFGATFRMGYNILGFAAIEVNFNASGNGLGDGSTIEGQAGIYGIARIFPAQLFQEVADRWWDPYIFIGGGAHFIGYNPEARKGTASPKMRTDGRAWWPGSAITYGLGADFYLVRFFSLGIDLAFINAFHNTFRIDDKHDIQTEPIDTAKAFYFQPTVKLTFHFGTD